MNAAFLSSDCDGAVSLSDASGDTYAASASDAEYDSMAILSSDAGPYPDYPFFMSAFAAYLCVKYQCAGNASQKSSDE